MSCHANFKCWSGVFHVSDLSLKEFKSASSRQQTCHAKKVTEVCLPTFQYICRCSFVVGVYYIIRELPKSLETYLKNTKGKGFRICPSLQLQMKSYRCSKCICSAQKESEKVMF